MSKEILTIPELFSKTVSQTPQDLALQIKKGNQWQRLTFKDLETSALKLATFLVKEGFGRSDFAAIILENRPEWAAIYLGIASAGLTAVPLDPQLNTQELKNLIIDSTAKVIFCSYHIFLKKLKPNIAENRAKIVVLDGPDAHQEDFLNFSQIENITPDKATLPTVQPEDIASLIYTSGTTAKPKGVLLTHKNICSNFASVAKLNIYLSSDNILSVLPLYHTYAFMVTLALPLFLGARVTYCLSLKSQDIIQTVKEAKVTILVGVPQLFSLLHKAIFDRIKKIPFLFRPLLLPFIKAKLHKQMGESLRFLVSGGARLPPQITQDLSGLGFKLIEGYGLTETSPVVTLNPPQKIKPGSVGKSIPEVQIKILNPDKTGVGEVLIKGPNVMSGYFKQPDLTSQVIKEGWFYSGDLGYLDKEGYLFLVGREKEIIVLSSGKNISPEELEEHYRQSSYIKEMCILEKSEERFGQPVESLYAIVVADLEHFRQKNETDIRGKIRWELENLGKDLPSYKHIMGLTVIKEELPRTALKKIKRYQVREKYLLKKRPPREPKEVILPPEDLKGLNPDLAKKIINYISQQLNQPVYLDSHLEIDLGIDSLSQVELFLGLERLLTIKIPDEAIPDVSTVRDIIVTSADIIDQTASGIYKVKEPQRDWGQILKDIPARQVLLKKIRVSPRFLDKVLTLIFKVIFLFIFRIFWLLRVKRKNLLPAQGPYILCPNHASYLDGLTIFSSLDFPKALQTFFMGYSEIFDHPLLSWATKLARLISIDTAAHLSEAMQAAAFLLEHQKILCIFPEGRRSIDENIAEFKGGIGILIKELGIPVVPVYIKGSHYSWPRGVRLPRFCPLKVIFGRSLSAEELIKMAKKRYSSDDYEAIAKTLREEVLKLAC